METCQISRNGPAISHLLFADDCLLFTQAKASQARLAQEVLRSFCHASGLKVNVQKTRFLATKNVARFKIDKYAAITGFQSTTNLGRYLGFPLFSGRVKKGDFGFIMDKINGRLASWKGKLFNRAGRITLAKSVISSMPIYTMQNNWLHEGVCDKLNATVRNFIWGGNHSHWVKWGTITQPMKISGLGIHIARNTNISLLGKHVWDLIHTQDKLWVQCLPAKYLHDTDILTARPILGASYTWNSILKKVNVLKSGFEYRIGKGKYLFGMTSGLMRITCATLFLMSTFRTLICSLRISTVIVNGIGIGLLLQSLLQSSCRFKASLLMIRLMIFSLGATQLQVLTLLEKVISGSIVSIVLIEDPVSPGLGSGVSKFLKNIRHFLLLALQGALLTNLFRHRRHLTNDASCHRCGALEESILHTIRDCPYAARIWLKLQFYFNSDFST